MKSMINIDSTGDESNEGTKRINDRTPSWKKNISLKKEIHVYRLGTGKNLRQPAAVGGKGDQELTGFGNWTGVESAPQQWRRQRCDGELQRAGARSKGLLGEPEELKCNSNTEGGSKGLLRDGVMGAEAVSEEVVPAAVKSMHWSSRRPRSSRQNTSALCHCALQAGK